MGNRAVITTKEKNLGVYLHWNGGRDSVEAFLKYCEIRGFRGFPDDYGIARLVQVISNFFGSDGLSIGVAALGKHYKKTIHIEGETYIDEGYEGLDCNNGDNGMYIVDNWDIVGREFCVGPEQHYKDLLEMLEEIDKAQPIDEQLGIEEIKKRLAELDRPKF